MAFLLCFTFSLSAVITFDYAWRSMPVRWLFDCRGLSHTQASEPHPKAGSLPLFPHGFLLFCFFFEMFLTLSQKVALTGVFWGLSLFWFLVQIGLSDLHYRLIPDPWSFGIVLLGLIRPRLFPEGQISTVLSQHFPALILCIFLTLTLYFLPRHITGSPCLGLGDVKLISALAVALTTQEFFAVMTSAALLGGAVAAGMLLKSKIQKTDLSDGVPYGTVIAASVFLHIHFFA